ncbi:COG3904 family protein [Paracoccus zhejiangensis]|uniref:Periplasmic protein-like protein n=1 Tax=Paracoccus zhejiangensis TaxID=1077935 RepID=A0A2H5F5D7_9RHOB|nr:hypothetical protein [Paracoccus zhejiangensis]AUH66759.1 hypothetical protein CX676_20860 [Paracoccus zhejiangensis]
MRFFSSPQAAIKAVLLSQVILGAGIVYLDMLTDSSRSAPSLFAPEDGAGIRPYRPDLRTAPDPSQPGAPAMRPMPTALEFAETEGAIRLDGQIATGDADRFAAWMDEARPTATLVSLDSSGGSVSDALAIGRTIRAAGFDTVVEDGAVCLSACPYLLAAGVNRRVEPGGFVGVHQHYFGKNTMLPAFLAVSDLQRAQASVMVYLTEMGVDLRLMVHALRTEPDEINMLTPDQMRDLGLVTVSQS